MTAGLEELSFYQWLRVSFFDCMCSLISHFMGSVTEVHDWPKLAKDKLKGNCIHDNNEAIIVKQFREN